MHLQYVNIEEVTLTANQNFQEMLKEKLVWKTVDDAFNSLKHGLIVSHHEEFPYELKLSPQKIKQFIFSYVPSGMDESDPPFLQ